LLLIVVGQQQPESEAIGRMVWLAGAVAVMAVSASVG
jgi:hypothetical protein